MTGHGGLEVDGVPGAALRIRPGEMVALIGPSGSGKTTLLRRIAGLDPGPPAFRVRIGGADMTAVPVQRRPLTLMVEAPLLFPRLTVAQNVDFAVDRRRGSDAAQDELDTALTVLDLRTLAGRLPRELSAGERQRVALARALVRRPAVMLFDEPLVHVDPTARAALLREIVRTHQRMGSASLIVTHDWTEALAVADRIAILREGRIVQVDAPRDLYRRPASSWVASRVGVPNFLPARVIEVLVGPEERRVRVSLLGRTWEVPSSADLDLPGQECVVLGHAHAVRLRRIEHGDELDPGCGRVLRTTFQGDQVEYDVESDAGTLVVRRPLGPTEEPWEPGTEVALDLVPEAMWVVPR